MKTYDQLTPEQQAKAVARCLRDTLEDYSAATCYPRVEDAWKKANDMQKPWLINEYLLEGELGVEIRESATQMAKNHMFAEPGEMIMRGIL